MYSIKTLSKWTVNAIMLSSILISMIWLC